MAAALKWRYRPPLFSRVKRENLVAVEGILRGVGRDLIDQRIAHLVAAMNVPSLMHTVACCEGHGGWASFSSPYVTFEAPVELAAMLNERLWSDSMQAKSQLNYFWAVEGGFGTHRQIIFRLFIPGIDRYRWVSRKRLDADIACVRSMMLNALAQYRA
jgi:hypothetical protein